VTWRPACGERSTRYPSPWKATADSLIVTTLLVGGLALSPVVIALHYLTELNDTALFVLSALALIPLAWLIGEATEHAAEFTGPGIGGFLNATFGNAPELIIALIAVHDGLTEVVRGSLTGSVIGNLLLVLGFSLVAGGTGELERWSSLVSFGAIGIAIALFMIPAAASWRSGDPDSHHIARLSVPVSIALEPLIDGSSMRGGYFDLGSATFNMTRIVTGQLDAYVDVGHRIVDEVPSTEAAFLAVGEGSVCTNFPYDVAAAALIVQEAGGVVTHADGRPLEDAAKQTEGERNKPWLSGLVLHDVVECPREVYWQFGIHLAHLHS
jgi:hypothetical protein